ncbi:MAG: hypothetical protein IJS09_02920, partial [Treponema sp.]|nr:hypothetical protein [Treponema sp.]
MFSFAASVVFVMLSCASTEVAPRSTIKQTEKKTELTASSSKKPASPAPTVPPEVKFAQNVGTALESGNTEKALALFDTMPASMQNDSELQTLKASLLLSSGKTGEAEGLAKELLAANPKDVDVLGLNVMVAKSKGDSKTKTALLKQILAIDPKNSDANLELGDEQALKHN